jgi:hypothetical protein
MSACRRRSTSRSCIDREPCIHVAAKLNRASQELSLVRSQGSIQKECGKPEDDKDRQGQEDEPREKGRWRLLDGTRASRIATPV